MEFVSRADKPGYRKHLQNNNVQSWLAYLESNEDVKQGVLADHDHKSISLEPSFIKEKLCLQILTFVEKELNPKRGNEQLLFDVAKKLRFESIANKNRSRELAAEFEQSNAKISNLEKEIENSRIELERLHQKENTRLKEMEIGNENNDVVCAQRKLMHEKEAKIMLLETEIEHMKDRKDDNAVLTFELYKAKAQIKRLQNLSQQPSMRVQNYHNSCRYCSNKCRQSVCKSPKCQMQRNAENQRNHVSKKRKAD